MGYFTQILFIVKGISATELENSIKLEWEDACDVVDPFGDRRGDQFASVWIFDLNKDILVLSKTDQKIFVTLDLARKQPLALADFKPLHHSAQLYPPERPPTPNMSLAGPYWKPKLTSFPREQALVYPMLRDFGYTWRHVLRRGFNHKTFLKMAYVIAWMVSLNFTLKDRVGFEHISMGGKYVWLDHLPSWDTPESPNFQVGLCHFTLAQDITEGLQMVRQNIHTNENLEECEHESRTYVILTIQHVVLCMMNGGTLVWTKPEALFNMPTEDTANDLIAVKSAQGDLRWKRPKPTFPRGFLSEAGVEQMLWAVNWSRPDPSSNTLHLLPLEIQDRIIRYATSSPLASAMLGCELGLGSGFTWVDERGQKIGTEDAKRHRAETSPVESYILLNGSMSGLAYKAGIKSVTYV